MAETVVRTSPGSAPQPAADEREARVQLAAAYRLAQKYGMDEIINTHISMRVPGAPTTFLIKPDELLFDEVKASNLIRLDLAGNPIDASDSPPNRVGAAIHGAILEDRSDVNCVFHTHTPYATAVSTLECGLLPMSQAALRFYDDVAYHDYGRAGDDALERSRLGEDMGNKAVMLLRNHGVLATGRTAADAFNAAFYLEKACQFQVLAQSTGQKVMLPQHPSRVGPLMRAWPTLMRMLEREDPSYKD